MNEIKNIEERIVTYYNDLIKNNVIAGKAPVTLEWMKRQRILEGRDELNFRFGHEVVDSILGKKTPLAKAEHYLKAVHKHDAYNLLPEIACLLAEECTTMLPPNNSTREIYKSLKQKVEIQIIDLTFYNIYIDSIKNETFTRSISIPQLKYLTKERCSNTGNLTACTINYMCECVYFALVDAFNNVKEAVQNVVK